MRCGIFTRGDRPLRWRTLCEVCRRPVGVPFYFWTRTCFSAAESSSAHTIPL
jgi:hypothetical protein